MAVGKLITVFHAQRTFGELGRHAEKARNHHPECRPRPANADSHGHARDVAQTHGARQRGCKRLKVADLARVIRIRVIAPHQLDRMPEAFDLNGTEIDGKDQTYQPV